MKKFSNKRPIGFTEVEEDTFYTLYYFHYISNPPLHWSIQYDENSFNSGLFSCSLYELEYSGCEGMGYAIAWDWKENKPKYYVFGEPDRWESFKARFAAQFAGDNS